MSNKNGTLLYFSVSYKNKCNSAYLYWFMQKQYTIFTSFSLHLHLDFIKHESILRTENIEQTKISMNDICWCRINPDISYRTITCFST